MIIWSGHYHVKYQHKPIQKETCHKSYTNTQYKNDSIILDNNYIRITIVEHICHDTRQYENSSDFGYKIKVENKTDHILRIDIDYGAYPNSKYVSGSHSEYIYSRCIRYFNIVLNKHYFYGNNINIENTNFELLVRVYEVINHSKFELCAKRLYINH